MSYRGIENWYADCWEFIDGINIQNYKVFLNQNPATFADDVFTGDYVDSGVTLPAMSASYIKKIQEIFSQLLSEVLAQLLLQMVVGQAPSRYACDFRRYAGMGFCAGASPLMRFIRLGYCAYFRRGCRDKILPLKQLQLYLS